MDGQYGALWDDPFWAAAGRAILVIPQPNALKALSWADELNGLAKEAGEAPIAQHRRARPGRLLEVRLPGTDRLVDVPLWRRTHPGDIDAVQGAMRLWQQYRAGQIQQSDVAAAQEHVGARAQPGKGVTCPVDKAFIAWRLQKFMGITNQTEIAKVMTEQGEPASQGTVSRWLQQVEDYQRAGEKMPPLEIDRAISVDPAVIDQGPRQDGRRPTR